jgi:hypothetical protein
MAGESIVRDAVTELAGKAVMWIPAIAGTILLGPAGGLLGFAASVAIVTSASSNSPPGGDRNPQGRDHAG